VRLQLEGPDLEGLLSRVNEEYGANARIVDAEKVRSGGIGGFFAREHFAMTVEVDDEPELFNADQVPDTAAALLGLADAVEDQRVSTTTQGFAQVLHRLVESAGPTRPTQEPVTPPGAFEPLLPPPAIAAPAIAASAIAAPAVAATAMSHDERQALARLGLPATLMPTSGSGELESRLLLALAALPDIHPAAPATGLLQVVIGERNAALDTATTLAEQWGVTAQNVSLIADRPALAGVAATQAVTGAQGLHSRHAAAYRRGEPLIVAIDERFVLDEPRDANWPAGLRPFITDARRLGVVPASAKPEDITRWAQRVGGIDALAVIDLDGTGSPATVLATGLPVALIENRTATPTEWAALLCSRLAARA